MPSVKIRCHYDQMQQVVKVFKDQHSALTQMNNKIKSAQETLVSGDWIGKGAKQFYSEMDQKVMPSLKRLANAMDAGATHLSKAHKIMHQAEQDSSKTFKVEIVINL